MSEARRIRGAWAVRALIALSALAVAAGARAEQASTLLREQRWVTIGGKTERWRLEWEAPPQPVCAPDEDYWATCPCSGFAFGESGKLDLVRFRPP